MTKDHTPSAPLARRFWRDYLRRETPTILCAFLLMAIEGASLGALSKTMEPLFDQVLAQGAPRSAVVWVGAAILGLFTLRAVVSVSGKTLMATVTQRVAAAMQTNLLRHLLRLETGFFQRNAPGVLIERVQGDTQAVQGIWSTLVVGLGRDLVGLLALLVVAISIDPMWTLAASVGAPLLILPSVLLQRYIRRKSVQLRNEAGQRATRLDEIFHGIQAVKLNRLEEYQANRFAKVLNRIRRAEVRIAFGRQIMPGMLDIVTGLGFFLVLLLAAQQIAAGERTTGQFMAFFTAMALTFQPLRRLGEASGGWQVAAASLERIYALFDSPPEERSVPATVAVAAMAAPEVAFDGVTFAHGEAAVLHGVSFSAPAGKTTAIVGPSGAGKTTLFHLMTGLLQPDAGQIRVGGRDVATMTLAEQRSLFASVTQDAALFDETLRENVTLGRDVSAQALEAALERAQVAGFLRGLPLGLDTPVGPRGSALSGGQRQRVAIARAILRDAPVLLLDEATSALDSQSETLVAEALHEAGRGRTTLVVAHRLATVRGADRILVMQAGRVVDQGTHDDLLERGGLYADLYRLQFKE